MGQLDSDICHGKWLGKWWGGGWLEDAIIKRRVSVES